MIKKNFFVGLRCCHWFGDVCHEKSMDVINIFFFYQGFLSRTLTTHRTAGEGRGPFFISLYHFHPRTNIQTFICNFACEMTTHIFNRIVCIYQTATWWDLQPYRVTIWLIGDVILVFVCLRDDLILAFLLQQFETGNRWIRTRIDYHPYITSKTTNQVS